MTPAKNKLPVQPRWRELNGENNWEGLLDPLDLNLRQHLINYGELVQAVYDAFNDDPNSRFAGGPRYSRRNFFDRVFLTAGRPYRYRVTKFVYATSGVGLPEGFILRSLAKDWKLNESNWLGYVAVATDEGKAADGRRDVLVACRGTVRALEWVNNLEFGMVSGESIVANSVADGVVEPQVHGGWMSLYTSTNPKSPLNKSSARDQVLTEVRRLIQLHKDEEVTITVTGHSLGAALATLISADIVSHGFNVLGPRRTAPVTAFVFASPRVGDAAFAQSFAALAPDLRLLRVTNAQDVVPLYPPIGFADVGAELVVDARKSEFVKGLGGPAAWHSLEFYLHGVAGTQGRQGGFKLEVERDIALLNKYMDEVREEYSVPASWWVEKNKGMVQGKDGHWRLHDHEMDDDDLFMEELLKQD
ncbi:hypothetical protein HPP92_003656 [Vanilla planifolia]|uniref:Phospholipase A1 n=1 Tax=Vanilla planifolia TaxID=51239 RepID=A0A835RUU7_VANPL|nr:hypothetical protein HPP92_003656 [Vanilla planifolia]